jgi:dTDP-4-dehydrorhamnose reductase
VSVTVLVTGAAGQVGVDLLDVLAGVTPLGGDPDFQPDGVPVAPDEFRVLGLSHHDLDITDAVAVRRALEMSRPDVVVHLAAYTAVDRAEDDVANAFLVNEVGTQHLVEASHAVGAHLIYVSTDYVFDGLAGRGYDESDTPAPVGVYARSKYAGELACGPDDTIVRVSWVMGVRGKNVAHIIAQRAASGEHVRFVEDQTGTVTLAADLARALVCFIRTRVSGTWHVANTGTTTWFGVAQEIGTICGRDANFAVPIRTSDLDPAPRATRPPRSDLVTTKFATAFSPLPRWQDGVARLVRDREALS